MADLEGSLAQLNQQFARPNINDIDQDLFDGTHSPEEIAGEIGLTPSDDEGSILTTIPDGMLAALLAFIHDDLVKDERIPIMFAYAPGAEWEMTFHYPGPCGHTVMMRSKLPQGLAQG